MADVSSFADNEGTVTIGISGAVIALALIFTVLRFYVRITLRAGLWWDDWLIAVAVVATLALIALILWSMLLTDDP